MAATEERPERNELVKTGDERKQTSRKAEPEISSRLPTTTEAVPSSRQNINTSGPPPPPPPVRSSGQTSARDRRAEEVRALMSARFAAPSSAVAEDEEESKPKAEDAKKDDVAFRHPGVKVRPWMPDPIVCRRLGIEPPVRRRDSGTAGAGAAGANTSIGREGEEAFIESIVRAAAKDASKGDDGKMASGGPTAVQLRKEVAGRTLKVSTTSDRIRHLEVEEDRLNPEQEEPQLRPPMDLLKAIFEAEESSDDDEYDDEEDELKNETRSDEVKKAPDQEKKTKGEEEPTETPVRQGDDDSSKNNDAGSSVPLHLPHPGRESSCNGHIPSSSSSSEDDGDSEVQRRRRRRRSKWRKYPTKSACIEEREGRTRTKTHNGKTEKESRNRPRKDERKSSRHRHGDGSRRHEREDDKRRKRRHKEVKKSSRRKKMRSRERDEDHRERKQK
mmetsp:Transcript_19190/g.43703  ORF Transcript_19190/g.43703 Transcript_19190/m.43703 type:complete len:445 (+) Transcript_19190:677-2011(+)